jgi:hypothetical protein
VIEPSSSSRGFKADLPVGRCAPSARPRHASRSAPLSFAQTSTATVPVPRSRVVHAPLLVPRPYEASESRVEGSRASRLVPPLAIAAGRGGRGTGWWGEGEGRLPVRSVLTGAGCRGYDFEKVFYVSAVIEGPGRIGVGTWATNSLQVGEGLIIAANDYAREVTDWGEAAKDGSPAAEVRDMANDGATESQTCVTG